MKHQATQENLPGLLATMPPIMRPSTLELRDVYDNLLVATNILYSLLEQSTADDNISHKVLPSHEEHLHFILSRPYRGWSVITNGTLIIGAIYISRLNEFGVRIFKDYYNQGYEAEAVRRMARLYPAKRYLFNINPRNERAKGVIDQLNGKLIQHTFEVSL